MLYPNDKTSLIKLHQDLTMELLWIEQAIESRISVSFKYYLCVFFTVYELKNGDYWPKLTHGLVPPVFDCFMLVNFTIGRKYFRVLHTTLTAMQQHITVLIKQN